jgi:hypothetical protein
MEQEGEGAVEGRAYEVGGEEGEWGYARGRWGEVCERVAMRLRELGEGPELVSCTYANLEDMKGDRAVYKAVARAIREEHSRVGGDGATLADITGETAAQRRVGRIRYVVVAEAPRGGDGGAAATEQVGAARVGAVAAEGQRRQGDSVGGGGVAARSAAQVLRQQEAVRTVANESDEREGERRRADAVEASGQDGRKRRGLSWTRV